MEKCYRIVDDGDRWAVIVGYNRHFYADFYFSKEKYRPEDVVVQLIDRRIIEIDTPVTEDEIWAEVLERHREVMADEQKHGLDTSSKWAD